MTRVLVCTNWKLHACPRCRGDLLLEVDHIGCHYLCIQCGYIEYLGERLSQEEAVALRGRGFGRGVGFHLMIRKTKENK